MSSQPPPAPIRTPRRKFSLWAAIGTLLVVLFILLFAQPNSAPRATKITLDELATYMRNVQVAQIIVVGGQDVYVNLTSGEQVWYYKARETDLFASLEHFGVTEERWRQIQYSERPGDSTSTVALMAIAVLFVGLPLWRIASMRLVVARMNV